jgi:16S rRNA processing protein RimM
VIPIPDDSNYVTLARILRPQGRRGEIAAEILTDFPGRLAQLKSVYLWDGEAARRSVAILSFRLSTSRGGQAVFHFEDSNSISDAEKLVGLQLQVLLAERVVLPAGNYFVSDLIGCEVFAEGARRVGVVADVQPTGEDLPGTPVLVVESTSGEILIPLAEEICTKIDVAARRIELSPPEGLLELNQA